MECLYSILVLISLLDYIKTFHFLFHSFFTEMMFSVIKADGPTIANFMTDSLYYSASSFKYLFSL